MEGRKRKWVFPKYRSNGRVNGGGSGGKLANGREDDASNGGTKCNGGREPGPLNGTLVHESNGAARDVQWEKHGGSGGEAKNPGEKRPKPVDGGGKTDFDRGKEYNYDANGHKFKGERPQEESNGGEDSVGDGGENLNGRGAMKSTKKTITRKTKRISTKSSRRVAKFIYGKNQKTDSSQLLISSFFKPN